MKTAANFAFVISIKRKTKAQWRSAIIVKNGIIYFVWEFLKSKYRASILTKITDGIVVIV